MNNGALVSVALSCCILLHPVFLSYNKVHQLLSGKLKGAYSIIRLREICHENVTELNMQLDLSVSIASAVHHIIIT